MTCVAYDIELCEYFNKLYKHTHKDQQDAKVPRHGFQAQVKMARSEPLFQEADPHITKLVIEARMKDKDGPIKKIRRNFN